MQAAVPRNARKARIQGSGNKASILDMMPFVFKWIASVVLLGNYCKLE